MGCKIVFSVLFSPASRNFKLPHRMAHPRNSRDFVFHTKTDFTQQQRPNMLGSIVSSPATAGSGYPLQFSCCSLLRWQAGKELREVAFPSRRSGRSLVASFPLLSLARAFRACQALAGSILLFAHDNGSRWTTHLQS